MPDWRTCQRCGLKHTIRVDDVCPRCGETANAYAPPEAKVDTAFTPAPEMEALVRAIADAQRKMIVGFVFGWISLFVMGFLFGIFEGILLLGSAGMLAYPLCIVPFIYFGYRGYRVAEALGLEYSTGWCVAAAFPGVVGFVTVVVLSWKATRALAAAGCRVGILGTDPSKLTPAY